MQDEEQSKSKRIGEFFPYELWWENNPDRWVELKDLLANAALYEARFKTMVLLNKEEFRKLAVTRADLANVVHPLQLSGPEAAALTEVLFVLAGWLLTADHQRAIKQGHLQTLELFRNIAKTTRKLAGLLSDLPPDLADIVAGLINFDPPDDMFTKATYIDLQLLNFANRLEHLQPMLKRSRGRPENMTLKIAVHHLVHELIRLTGEPIEVVGSELRGHLGRFVMDYFQSLPFTHPEVTIARFAAEALKRGPKA